MNDRNVHLTLGNRGGSVEHYYHFLLGFLVPLLEVRDERDETTFFVRSCAVMDRLLREVVRDRMVVVDRDVHQRIGEGMASMGVEGYDTPVAYDRDVFLRARRTVESLLRGRIEALRAEFVSGLAPDRPVIVLIDREAPHAFYQSEHCEIRGAGASRRSIPNGAELESALAAESSNVLRVSLEEHSLAWQFALFSLADVVVAQHGAALANLLWCRPSAAVVEIHPDDMAPQLEDKGFFSRLSGCLGLTYEQVRQHGSHGAVDAGAVVAAVRDALGC
ncbi:glycosyltransferase 61 family protein [Sulfuriroseicoccus oceanibius]|uniref:Glycosyltransferase family 61 protein n=1 Tax=Sulfuriroseicoccus oceanibius TaxID=2707525 RepID=A0A6B3LEW8_9BACT|nr:glycosyltransferase family 61 protein [Sulfuriroseicoccus oceanibius]QQL45225.1 glycosyltransferase family 61 protein [Sulfuriroseicoccus oceanibius]